jgi:hypothetical protein
VLRDVSEFAIVAQVPEGPWARFFAEFESLSSLTDRQLEIARIELRKEAYPYGVPRKLKCAGCQLGEHCNGEDDGCWCECTEKANP